jgi:hypothetical protein
MSSRPKIVLVHGAFANAGCWAKLVPLLRAKGLSVVGEQDYMLTFRSRDGRCQRLSLVDNPCRDRRPALLAWHRG